MPKLPKGSFDRAALSRTADAYKALEEKRLARERPSGQIETMTGNILEYETLFDEIIYEMDKLHERIKVLEEK